MKIKPGEQCECGQDLPWHLFELGFGLEHICLCERNYKQEGDEVFLVGMKHNPFARETQE